MLVSFSVFKVILANLVDDVLRAISPLLAAGMKSRSIVSFWWVGVVLNDDRFRLLLFRLVLLLCGEVRSKELVMLIRSRLVELVLAMRGEGGRVLKYNESRTSI